MECLGNCNTCKNEKCVLGNEDGKPKKEQSDKESVKE